jgi:hypothetical protein
MMSGTAWLLHVSRCLGPNLGPMSGPYPKEKTRPIAPMGRLNRSRQQPGNNLRNDKPIGPQMAPGRATWWQVEAYWDRHQFLAHLISNDKMPLRVPLLRTSVLVGCTGWISAPSSRACDYKRIRFANRHLFVRFSQLKTLGTPAAIARITLDSYWICRFSGLCLDLYSR